MRSSWIRPFAYREARERKKVRGRRLTRKLAGLFPTALETRLFPPMHLDKAITLLQDLKRLLRL
jgi:hypothetical protein